MNSKKDMLKIEEINVAGRKTARNRESVFIEVLSLLALCARRRCSPAICRLSLDFLWDI
jgi:hypothetical protein